MFRIFNSFSISVLVFVSAALYLLHLNAIELLNAQVFKVRRNLFLRCDDKTMACHEIVTNHGTSRNSKMAATFQNHEIHKA